MTGVSTGPSLPLHTLARGAELWSWVSGKYTRPWALQSSSGEKSKLGAWIHRARSSGSTFQDPRRQGSCTGLWLLTQTGALKVSGRFL